jgi:hypothetical protein
MNNSASEAAFGEKWIAVAVAMVVALAATGCTSGSSENPVARTVGWFDYVAGGDIERTCGNVAGARYRFVYNAIYTEQVRTYDLTTTPGGDAGLLTARAFDPYSAVEITLSDPLAGWRGVSAKSLLDEDDVAGIVKALHESGFDLAAPVGLSLRSDTFYWVVAACRSGRFSINAWAAPSTEFADLSFPEVLFRHDGTGVAVNPVRPLDLGVFRHGPASDRSELREPQFLIRIGGDGRLN